jgi:hypothetical protein
MTLLIWMYASALLSLDYLTYQYRDVVDPQVSSVDNHLDDFIKNLGPDTLGTHLT